MVFLFASIIFISMNIVIIFSKLTIDISDFRFTSKGYKHLNDNYNITIKVKAFSMITIFKKVYNKNKIENINRKLNLSKKINMKKLIKEWEKDNQFNKNVIKMIIKDIFEIKKINLKIELGTKEADATAIIIGVISTIISIVLRSKIKNHKFQKFKVIPVYRNKNIIKISISGIFEIKVIHIINIIYILINVKRKMIKKNHNYFVNKEYVLRKESE